MTAKQSNDETNPITQKETWVVNRWRPVMGWTYIVICLFDFVIAPVARMLFAIYTNNELIPWESLTLSTGGMFHVSIGAVLGVTAWTRGQEKIQRMNIWEEYNTEKQHINESRNKNSSN